ncbi:hypothetical protein KBX71_02975 [Micromonospora sp. D93]|uniref:hypothetical protein n=1 Tax=Micromonospora sp. D93 TaxID=2824886 RepID=UPI001B398771|nr:hypothetical protein [Micromonospora sp. D93]MBQ1016824.1 hypothetical protein [Micromonospora sp. D93]
MPDKDQVLRLLDQGHGYPEVGRILGIPAGQAYLIATGVPADNGDTVTRERRERPGILPSRTQRLVNDREVNPTSSERVHEWVRRRAAEDHQMQDAHTHSAS